jgi:hypothetical protein|tara:strand:+ start:835 stop:1110 length:276 start_codon:yes stop_codon:yes gene_type:complete
MTMDEPKDVITPGHGAFDALDRKQERRSRDRNIRALVREGLADLTLSDGTLELDDNAIISEGDENGAYVSVWLWCGFDGTALDKKINKEEN